VTAAEGGPAWQPRHVMPGATGGGWPSLNARGGPYRQEMMSAMTLLNGRRAPEGSRPAWRPMPAWSWMLAAAAAVVITAFVVTTWLLAIASGAKPGTDQANARLDAVRTGLAAGAGAGAAVGLMLAFRRQHHQEIATGLTDRDATERRITELYTRAVEQLGSDKAPVRLGGLYALERLAQDNPAHRQTIVNVICAYLRMPFSGTPSANKPELEATEDPGEAEPNADGSGAGWQQEKEVRYTAQRILADHLRDDRTKQTRSTQPPSPRYWPDIRLDLNGATLIGFDLENGMMADAYFNGATFSGGGFFDGTTFSGRVGFGGATFDGQAAFRSASFGDVAVFDATFCGDAIFERATFRGNALFYATFRGDAIFERATFMKAAAFEMATFSDAARFDRASFSGVAGSLSFDRSHVLSPSAQHVWPPGWRLGPDGSGGYTVVPPDDDTPQLAPVDGSGDPSRP
jgi:uncharacterized protein YjbI with pentapeptide repeats